MKTHAIKIKQQPLKMMGSLFLMIVFALMASSAMGQSTKRTVSGVVKTGDGPLPYTAVVLKGSTVGTTTDENGAFTFPQKLKENDVLVISSLAYDDHEIVIKGDTSYVEPFLEGSALIIVGALRTRKTKTTD